MKKTVSLILTLCLVTGLTIPFASASSADKTSAQQITQALGIINGDENGNMNLSSNVTRAQFAKMMIAASKYKDSISSTANASPFKDVKYTHWAASYIKTAVNAGWITGYTDGTYRPDNYVKLEEAVTAVLKMLGYTSTDFAGSFPEAQLAKYSALGLNKGISTTQGSCLTRQDCVYLFYNLMGTKSTSNTYYATSLDYTVNSSGEIDYSSLVLNNMEGPFIVNDSSWISTLPFSSSASTVYRNGSLSSISAVSEYDVLYYNTSMQTVWAYSRRITGVYTAASPNTAAPTSVTVAGNSYKLSTSTAIYDLSDIGTYSIGDTVTLLLGKDGDVVGVLSAKDINTSKYGIVTATGTQAYTDTAGKSYTVKTITLASTDGCTYKYEYDSYSSFKAGELVQAVVNSGVTTVSSVNENSISGTVNPSATAVGSYYFADDVQIMDTTKTGFFVKIYPTRLAGLRLGSDNVRFYVLNDSGKISQLILNDVTGDMYNYGILTSLSTSSSPATYNYIIDGSTGSLSSSAVYGVSTGPAQFELEGSNIITMKNLTKISLSSLNSQYATNGSTQYTLGEGLDVYLYNGYNSYTLTSITDVSDTSVYTLYGYYDKLTSAGGRIRVIIAQAIPK